MYLLKTYYAAFFESSRTSISSSHVTACVGSVLILFLFNIFTGWAGGSGGITAWCKGAGIGSCTLAFIISWGCKSGLTDASTPASLTSLSNFISGIDSVTTFGLSTSFIIEPEVGVTGS